MAQRPESDIFRKNIPTIAQAIADSPGEIQWLADELAAMEFIGDTGICVTLGLSPYQQASGLLRAMQSKVTASYEDTGENFLKFTDILRMKKPWKRLGEHLLKEYERQGGSVGGRLDTPDPVPASDTAVPQPSASRVCRNAFADKQPTLQEFTLLKWREKRINIRDSVAPKWRDLGANLGFSIHQLDIIEQSSLKDVTKCASALFGEWQRTTGGYNWEMLIEALEDADFAELARETREALMYIYS